MIFKCLFFINQLSLNPSTHTDLQRNHTRRCRSILLFVPSQQSYQKTDAFPPFHALAFNTKCLSTNMQPPVCHLMQLCSTPSLHPLCFQTVQAWGAGSKIKVSLHPLVFSSSSEGPHYYCVVSEVSKG